MEEDNFIPKFKPKELKLEYSSKLYEDEEFKKLKFLWTSMDYSKLEMSISQIMTLMDYEERMRKYRNDLISLLKGEKTRIYTGKEVIDFQENFSSDSKAEQLIFNIILNINNELFWAEDVLNTLEYNQNEGDE